LADRGRERIMNVDFKLDAVIVIKRFDVKRSSLKRPDAPLLDHCANNLEGNPSPIGEDSS
jgi:hypothetical protein